VILLRLLDLSAAFDCVDYDNYYVGYAIRSESADPLSIGYRRSCPGVHSKFLARVSTLPRDIDMANLSIGPSACPSVTFRYCMKTD